MHQAQAFHTASVLKNGKVLVAGGYGFSSVFSQHSELYDPSTGTWIITDSVNHTRYQHTATVLINGKVLMSGRATNDGYLNSTELY